MRSKHKIKEEINEQWPESARTVMLEKQEWYDHPRIYQYGFYDGYQHAVAESVGERAEIERKDKLIEQMLEALEELVELKERRHSLPVEIYQESREKAWNKCRAAIRAAKGEERGQK